MSGIYKCNIEAGKEYEVTINEYLKSKGIKDFSKYEYNFKKDKLKFTKWDYPNIDKPKDIKPKTIQVNYHDLYPRVLKIKITNNNTFKCFNSDGDKVLDGDTYKDGDPIPKDKQNRSVQMIYEKNKFDNNNNKWKIYTDPSKGIYIWKGMLTFDHKITGEYNIVVFYRLHTENTLSTVSWISESDGRPHPPEDTISIKDSQKFYTIPKDL